MIVLGFDPGTATTGFGVVRAEGGKLFPVDVGTLLTPSTWELSDRLKSIFEDVHTLIDRFQPDAVAMERLFFDKNITNGLTVARAIGAVQVATALRGIPWFEYTPMQVKTAVTGYGGADKLQIQAMVVRLLGLVEVPKPDDAADALAVAICHANSHKMKSIGVGRSRGHRRDRYGTTG